MSIRSRHIIAVLTAIAAIPALLSGPAQASDQRLGTANKTWHGQDNCTRQAFQKYPDYTEAGAAQRDTYVRQCLRDNRLPPRSN